MPTSRAGSICPRPDGAGAALAPTISQSLHLCDTVAALAGRFAETRCHVGAVARRAFPYEHGDHVGSAVPGERRRLVEDGVVGRGVGGVTGGLAGERDHVTGL